MCDVLRQSLDGGFGTIQGALIMLILPHLDFVIADTFIRSADTVTLSA